MLPIVSCLGSFTVGLVVGSAVGSRVRIYVPDSRSSFRPRFNCQTDSFKQLLGTVGVMVIDNKIAYKLGGEGRWRRQDIVLQYSVL